MGNRYMVEKAKECIEYDWWPPVFYRSDLFPEKLKLFYRSGKRKIHFNPIMDSWEMVGFDPDEQKEIYDHFKMVEKKLWDSVKRESQ